REYSHIFPPKPMRAASDAVPALEARNLSWSDRLDNVSLSVGVGEVVGLGGLDGQGQRELLLAFFGVLRGLSGQILVDGKPVSIASPSAASDDRVGMAL
ncbi:ATP-binding cassette domain-containing protein, partial [Mesorhizobium sp. M4B.F.Ca.ET.214.01.1.1]|uniref:ATP-binding cassette domain-containing protein n=1 Tax=Mesorhizobium sp. M4B.F.Ca.ET.214.01.1.1 TaxID=2563955 RepID=UPI001093E91D